MISVLTGDVVDSQKLKTGDWMPVLKSVLSDFGCHPADWQLFRGDSFQLLLGRPSDSLHVALRLRASLKQACSSDVRLAIGIGGVEYRADSVSESTGSAFVRSGNAFDGLRTSKSNLTISSPWPKFDEEMNLYFRFALVAIDDWSSASAEYVDLMLSGPRPTQEELATHLGISQSSVSARKSRAHFDELVQLDLRFRDRLQQEMQNE